jgi:hypothetical protein
MKKYRVYNERGYIETTDVAFAKQMNGGTLTGVDCIDFELTNQQNTVDKRAMYQAECDHITAEITRRKLIDDLSIEEESKLLTILEQKSLEIKNL